MSSLGGTAPTRFSNDKPLMTVSGQQKAAAFSSALGPVLSGALIENTITTYSPTYV